MRPAVLVLAFVLWAGVSSAQQPPLPPDYETRLAELEQARRARPDDLQVLDALAGSYAMGSRYDPALEVVRRMLQVGGENPVLRLRLARLYSWSGRPDQALAELHRAPGPRAPEALEFECQILSTVPRAAEAAACYERLVGFELQAARNWSWAGRTRQAAAHYEAYLRSQPQDRSATLELIRLYRYRGAYGAAEGLCDRLLAATPDDTEVLALKAEVLHWTGQKWFLARRTADQAVRLAPGYPDARVAQIYALRRLGERHAASQSFADLERDVNRLGLSPEATYTAGYRLLESDFGHPWHLSETPAYSVYNDSDAIRNVYSGLSLALPVRADHTLRLELGNYQSSAPAGSVFTASGRASHASEFQAGGTFLVAPGAHLTLAGGASLRSGSDALRGVYDFRLEASPADRWTLELASSREFLKVTPRSIDLDTSSYRVGAGVEYHLSSRTSLALRAGRRYWSDGNRSVAAEGQFRRILHYHKPFMIDAGLLHRLEQFERDTNFAAGFFTPDQYRRHDGFLGLHGEVARWLTYEVRGAGGAHKVTHVAGYRPGWEFTSSASLWFTRSLGLYASYQRRNYSLLARDGWYQGFYFGLAVRQ